MRMIYMKNLTKTYGRARGVTDLTLHVPAGSCFGFIGPNGAGKSTTIRTLLGLIAPTSGSAEVMGLDCVRDRTAILAQVGYMPSEAAFYPEMRVSQVIRLSADLRKKDCRAEAAELCRDLELDTRKKIRELSLGNRKKVSIVCAMQHRPRLYVLDEPTSGLDPLVQRAFWSQVERRRQEGAAVFLSSHVLYEVQRYCDRAAIIREGRLVVEGTTAELDIENRFFDYYEGRAAQ
ncbi:MAG: ABC transporter ATP-binding protein [Oscillospiraceae bacterium]|nr:ABC transporter ATP-binding protein [Oscillospiraceae bacterium]